MTAITQNQTAESDRNSDRKSISRERKVLARVGYSRSSVREMVRRGEFPAPIRLGPRAVGWLDDEIDAWIEARIAASRQSKA